ncbi:hypothetical protein AWC38_SpisGene20314 [Stylophora pistillata]|uniref:AAA+ ATPase domain-containing protein n=1 Tax=Stylophora pistillata TaxID=50429 RepID=A0A2B4RCT5_STYPI|nr:hypothetical protein AWC38_SpisGene20314 [Stylophora pistillata]
MHAVHARVKYQENVLKEYKKHAENETFPKRLKSMKHYPKMQTPEAQKRVNEAYYQVECTVLDQAIQEIEKNLAVHKEQYQSLLQQRQTVDTHSIPPVTTDPTQSFDLSQRWCEGFKFKSPSSIFIVDPSGCGKTCFTKSLLLQHLDEFFASPPAVIHYCCGAWQDGYREMHQHGIKFHDNLTNEEQLKQWLPKDGGILVMDDLMTEGGDDKEVLDLSTKHSHHRNITVIYLCQDMFPPSKYAKSISRNAHNVVAFKNARDQLGFKHLLLQAFPMEWQDIMQVYCEATQRPYGYITLDLHPASKDAHRVFSHLLTHEGCMRLYPRKDLDVFGEPLDEDEEPENTDDEDNDDESEDEDKDDDKYDDDDDNGSVNPWSELKQDVKDDMKTTLAEQEEEQEKEGTSENHYSLLPLARRNLRRIYLHRLKWYNHIKQDKIHRQAMYTARRLMNEYGMDWEEALEAAVDRRKFLLNRLINKPLLDESDNDDDEKEEEMNTV